MQVNPEARNVRVGGGALSGYFMPTIRDIEDDLSDQDTAVAQQPTIKENVVIQPASYQVYR